MLAACVGAEGRDDIVIAGRRHLTPFRFQVRGLNRQEHPHQSFSLKRATRSSPRRVCGRRPVQLLDRRAGARHLLPYGAAGQGPHGNDAFIDIQCFVDAHAHPRTDAAERSSNDALSVDNDKGDELDRPDAGVDRPPIRRRWRTPRRAGRRPGLDAPSDTISSGPMATVPVISRAVCSHTRPARSLADMLVFYDMTACVVWPIDQPSWPAHHMAIRPA